MNVHVTRNNLDSNTRTTVSALLNARLADAIDLALMTKQAHCNVRGRQFIAVHEMLDGLRAELDEDVDTVAERVLQLGGLALGTTQAVAHGSALKPYPADLVSVDSHIAALSERYAVVANSTRAAIEAAEEAGDANTADILTGFSRALDKALWLLEAHEAAQA
jgi:starvation-inducible DNA-binding protein